MASQLTASQCLIAQIGVMPKTHGIRPGWNTTPIAGHWASWGSDGWSEGQNSAARGRARFSRGALGARSALEFSALTGGDSLNPNCNTVRLLRINERRGGQRASTQLAQNHARLSSSTLIRSSSSLRDVHLAWLCSNAWAAKRAVALCDLVFLVNSCKTEQQISTRWSKMAFRVGNGFY
jgi:hypothetical protein